HLNFFYREKRPVLRDLSVSIKKGQMTAIVGPTGTGKTTLVHLLMRFYDCPPGSILVDGADIRDFKLNSWVERTAFVSQDPMLFNDTLRANIIYGLNRPVTDGEIMDAARKARLEDVILKLPEGLDTVIGERGAMLSGGEKQRVSITRAFLKDAEILILDEATSALDTKTERSIQQAIDEMGKKRTVIVIAHRLSTVVNADKVVVIEGGCVVEQGTLKTLLDQKGKFYEYWEAQKQRVQNFLEEQTAVTIP
ncbi:MAG: ATP-binding cassette domain-containing protein, partial [Candidatus Omnitrophica bacterium]|nr:ATP-binding cassette domain-containing protein [Candidatus Omnitrophota bacterium]